ncbi:MAG: Uma2 family endonuclease [Blastocatellia bacterium]
MKSIASVIHPIFRLTEKEYLENERHSDVRHEYLGGLIYAMAGASATHNLIALTLATRLRGQVRGKGCQVFISDMKLKIAATDTFYYPDVMMTCSPADNADYFRTSPVLIIEVASPTTAVTDRREKLLAYQGIASLREYVIVSQTEMSIQLYRRDPNGHWWLATLGADDAFELDSVGLQLSVREIYEDVTEQMMNAE